MFEEIKRSPCGNHGYHGTIVVANVKKEDKKIERRQRKKKVMMKGSQMVEEISKNFEGFFCKKVHQMTFEENVLRNYIDKKILVERGEFEIFVIYKLRMLRIDS